jgi:flagellar assembly protein FliH
MSSSKVYSQFSWTKDAHPVGNEHFVEEYLRKREEESSEGQQLRLLEQKHQAELQQAHQNGYAQGEAIGLQRGMDEARRVEGQLAATVGALLTYRNNLYEQASAQMTELAFAIADRVALARGVAERDTVIETINRCIAEILDKTKMRIKVNPAELKYVQQRFEAIVAQNDAAASAVIEADSRVSPGSCIIETDSGSADARIESQLRQLHEKLIAQES